MADLLDYALCTVADVKELLDIDAGDSSKNNLIIRKINQATLMIENYTGRRFKLTTYTNEEYDATGTDQLSLRQRPIVVDDDHPFSLGNRDTPLNNDDWSTIETDLQFLDRNAGVIDLNFRTWGHWNRFRVTYSAGYSTIPADIAEACATLAAFLVDNKNSGTGVKSRQEGQRKVEYFDVNANGNNNSLFSQLNIDEILDSYADVSLLDNK